MRRFLCGFSAAVFLLTGVFAGTVFAENKNVYKPCEATSQDSGPWSFYITTAGNDRFSGYQALDVTELANGTAISANHQANVRASISWSSADADRGQIAVMGERDGSSLSGKGQPVVSFSAPEDGNYKFSSEIKNVGNDVRGGDGGDVSLRFSNADSEWDTTIVSSRRILDSSIDETVKMEEIVSLKKGDRINMRFGVGIDGYGDKYMVKYSAEKTTQAGKSYVNRGLEGYLPNPPDTKVASGAPYREGLFWVGVDGGWADNKTVVPESIALLQKFFPGNLGMFTLGTGPERTLNGSFYAKKNIPAIVQTFGSGDFYKYYSETDAWEYDWNGKADAPGAGFALTGTGHAAAQSHSSVKKAFDNLIEASVRSGYTGYGYCDFVWDWGTGRGTAGFNKETIAAFRKDLKGEDEGLMFTANGGKAERIHFKDYAEYYTGKMLTPQDLGFETWDEYTPLKYEEYLKDEKRDWTPQHLTSDMLVSYEWLRVAQQFADKAKSEGGVCQIMPNPEDMANGGDLMFLNGIDSVDMTTEEYFGDTEYLDGAYYHFPYIKRNADDDISPGIVMEAGGGGNAGSYYDPEISYATAYELTAATGITHMEGDFWVSAPNSIAKNSQNSDFVERYQAILNYGIGYTDGMEDNVKPLDPDFISVTSRKVNRPWGQDWHPWTWHLNWNASPEWVLAKKGYIFNGISEDGIFDMIKEPQKVVSYSPDRPMKYHFDGMMEKSSQGLIENMIIPAISLRQIVTNDYALKDIGEVYPEFSAKHEKTKLSGILNDSEKTIVNTDTEVYTMENEGFTPVLSVGKTPVVVEKNNGKGKIYMVLFDPNAQENYELTAAVYNELLGKQGVKAHWETLEATGEAIGDDKLRDNDPLVGKGIMESEASVRLYQNDDLTVVGVQNPYARYHKKNEKRSTKLASPYEIKGNTKVKARLTPNVEYDWVALPSGKRGSVKADAEGFAEFGFSDTSHEIFYAMPKSAESSIKLSRILGRKLVLTDAISVDGNAQLADVCPPVTQLDVIGEKTATGSYKNGASVTLTATDSSRGSGMKRLEYSLNDGNFMSIRNRSALNKNEVSTSVKLNKNGVNTIKYRATDNRGNVEPLGTIEVVVD